MSKQEDGCRDIPARHKQRYTKRKTSRKAAIRSFCLECVGYVEKEVRLCTDKGCPLYYFRIGG